MHSVMSLMKNAHRSVEKVVGSDPMFSPWLAQLANSFAGPVPSLLGGDCILCPVEYMTGLVP